MLQGVLFDMDGLMFDTERIGRDGWHKAAEILHIIDLAVMAPARIVLAIGEQGHHQEQAQRTDGNQCAFLESVMQVLAPGRYDCCFRCCGGFLQNGSFPAPVAR